LLEIASTELCEEGLLEKTALRSPVTPKAFIAAQRKDGAPPQATLAPSTGTNAEEPVAEASGANNATLIACSWSTVSWITV
jgi:hypothetical protein